jgi:hypothetical protein
LKSEELILADWFSGKITIETDFTWGFIDEKGSFPDIRTLRVYTINKGRITYMVEECEFLDPMPF